MLGTDEHDLELPIDESWAVAARERWPQPEYEFELSPPGQLQAWAHARREDPK